MDLFLFRLAGSRQPAVDTLRAALQRQPWLTPEPGRRGVWARAFVFPGGQVLALRKLPDEPRYDAPGLLAALTPDADFATVAPLVRVAKLLHEEETPYEWAVVLLATSSRGSARGWR